MFYQSLRKTPSLQGGGGCHVRFLACGGKISMDGWMEFVGRKNSSFNLDLKKMFKVGEKIVCIDADGYFKGLVEGKRYTVKEVKKHGGLKLYEIEAPPPCTGFNPNRFQKIDYNWLEELSEELEKKEVPLEETVEGMIV
jgi:hypothetical protein